MMGTSVAPLPRERLGILAIEAELCPYVLARILALLAARATVAFTIHVRRGPQVQSIEIEINAEGGAAMPILHQLRRLPMVRQARLASLAERREEAIFLRAKI